MKILVLNCGSSSIKYKLYDMTDHSVMAQGGIEKIGLPGSFLKMTLPDGTKKIIEEDIPEHTKGVQFIFHILTDPELGALKSLEELGAVGHRMVHGGEKFNQSVLLTPEVLEAFTACNDLAPLHNPANLKGVNAVSALLPSIPQVGVFDTAFHQTMPKKAFLYGVPYEYYTSLKVRRYGFHGTSHRFIAGETPKFLGKKPEDCKFIICHLGNGSSLSAIVGGKVVDTSMGLTPLEGVLMGTRSGDVDPAVLEYIMDNTGMDIHQMLNCLNKKSGFAGLSCSSDMRDVKAAAEKGDEQAKAALDVWTYRIQKYIGAYNVAVGGADAIVFTAGIGENDCEACEHVINGLSFMGVKIDPAKNKRGTVGIISTDDSTIKVLRIPTNEELPIARDTLEIVSKL